MPELQIRFASRAEWDCWVDQAGEPVHLRDQILSDIKKNGLEEPFADIRRLPREIAINPGNLHETISSHGLNSRKRALLLQLLCEMLRRDWLARQRTRILAP